MSTGPSPPAVSQTPPPQAPAGFKPNYDILASLNSSRPTSQSSTPAPGPSTQVRQTATPPQATDPFASLMSASPRPASGAFQPPSQGQSTASSSLLDLTGGTTSPPQAPAPAAEDDDWNFASSLPTSNALPTKNQLQVLNTQLRVDFLVQRVPAYPRQIFVKAVFSNPTNQPIGDLHFQVAVEKVRSPPLFYGLLHATNKNSPIHYNLSPSLVEKLPRSSNRAFRRRWYWTELTRARETPSKFGSRLPTRLVARLGRNRGWCHLWE